MIVMSTSEIALAIRGRQEVSEAGTGDASVSGVSVTGAVQTDSRLVGPGDLFFALPGEVTDGHRFIGDAVRAGAVAVVAERTVACEVPLIIVPDARKALSDLAHAVVERVRRIGSLKVVAVTGSNGKTTTKNMLRSILQDVGPTVAPAGSLNNEVGAPMTVLGIDESTQFLVVEMGADAVGDISKLTAMVMPDVAIVLTVGLAHIGKFKDIAQTALAKSEMVRSLPDSAVAVLNADDPLVSAMAQVTRARVCWFGMNASPRANEDYLQLTDLSVSEGGTSFVAQRGAEHLQVHLQIIGAHHAMNALAALVAAKALGIQRASAVKSLEQMPRAERWRMEVLPGPNNTTVINDAYNASPDSMAAALRALAEVTRGRSRAIAVLGEMAELGDLSDQEHERIGLQVVRLNIDQLVVVGDGARRMHLAATREGSWSGESVFAPDSEAAYDVIRGMLQPGDVVLVKSSNSAGLRHLGDRIAGVEA